MSEPNKPKTIRVRIAVCISPAGSWGAAGWLNETGMAPSDDKMAAEATYGMPSVSSVHFIEADIPLPQTIEAEVK